MKGDKIKEIRGDKIKGGKMRGDKMKGDQRLKLNSFLLECCWELAMTYNDRGLS